MKIFSIIAVCVLPALSVVAQEVAPSDATVKITQDLNDAQARLTIQRDEIASEKPGVAQAFEQTRAELIEKRRKARIARMAKEDRAELIKELEKKHYGSAQNYTYVDGQLNDYGLILETFLLPGEAIHYQKALAGLRSLEGTPAQRLEKRLAVLDGFCRVVKRTTSATSPAPSSRGA